MRRGFPRRPRPRRPTPAAYTGCLPQPPDHSITAPRIWEVAERNGGEGIDEARALLREIYPKLLVWHRYLMTCRDPEGSGLVTIFHPWESGTDNSPRRGAALAAEASRGEVADLPPSPRYDDLRHVANFS